MKVIIFFSGVEYYGQYSSSFPRVARSVALFCPYCFRVWASLTETDELGRTETHHFAESVPCAEHPAWFDWQIPGSLIQRECKFGPSADFDLIPALPLELLARELDLHIKHWETQQCSSESTSLPASSASPPDSSSATAGGSSTDTVTC